MTHYAILLLACNGNKSDQADEAEPLDTTVPEEANIAVRPNNDAAWEACETPMEGTGDASDISDCKGGKCFVPHGAFWMGSSAPPAISPAECPARQVTLSGYYVDQAEVTIARYTKCVRDGGCEAQDWRCIILTEAEGADYDHAPMACVDWNAADTFCKWDGGRLPTEAEWEKAARGNEGAEYGWGEGSPLQCELVNFRQINNYCRIGSDRTNEFDHVKSPYGLTDTHGNVYEWTADWYDAEYYRKAPGANPPGPKGDSCHLEAGGPSYPCYYRVMRGGSWSTREDTIRNASRGFAKPETFDANIGFRCVYDTK